MAFLLLFSRLRTKSGHKRLIAGSEAIRIKASTVLDRQKKIPAKAGFRVVDARAAAVNS
jgi:hypothetical protein